MVHTSRIRPADGRLAVLIPGMGAVTTTLLAGVFLVRRGLGQAVGSLTQLGSLPLEAGKHRSRIPIREAVPLAGLDQLVFGTWDLFPDSAFAAAEHAGVLEPAHLALVREELEAIRPMTAAFLPQYVRKLDGPHVKRGRNKADLVEQLREDIRRFIQSHGCSRAVGLWCGSTEAHVVPGPAHRTVASFRRALERDDPSIPNSQLYAWAFLEEGIPFANGAPNVAADFPAALELARLRGVPLAGKDMKTGQTLMKTVIAPALRARALGVRGWFSTNILGNRDGRVLEDPESFRSKELTKRGVLDSILDPAIQPELYGDLFHKVRIEFYPPRGDAKEGWDNIDLFGWLGYPMQLKLDFLCRDSILAAPVALDLALLMDLCGRSGMEGIQEWLGFFFKRPTTHEADEVPEHDLFRQLTVLEDRLRGLGGPELGSELTPGADPQA